MCEITAEESLEVRVSGCESWLSALQPPAGGAHTPAALSHEAKHHKTINVQSFTTSRPEL